MGLADAIWAVKDFICGEDKHYHHTKNTSYRDPETGELVLDYEHCDRWGNVIPKEEIYEKWEEDDREHDREAKQYEIESKEQDIRLLGEDLEDVEKEIEEEEDEFLDAEIEYHTALGEADDDDAVEELKDDFQSRKEQHKESLKGLNDRKSEIEKEIAEEEKALAILENELSDIG